MFELERFDWTHRLLTQTDLAFYLVKTYKQGYKEKALSHRDSHLSMRYVWMNRICSE